jgi:hypothetical protein
MTQVNYQKHSCSYILGLFLNFGLLKFWWNFPQKTYYYYLILQYKKQKFPNFLSKNKCHGAHASNKTMMKFISLRRWVYCQNKVHLHLPTSVYRTFVHTYLLAFTWQSYIMYILISFVHIKFYKVETIFLDIHKLQIWRFEISSSKDDDN